MAQLSLNRIRIRTSSLSRSSKNESSPLCDNPSKLAGKFRGNPRNSKTSLYNTVQSPMKRQGTYRTINWLQIFKIRDRFSHERDCLDLSGDVRTFFKQFFTVGRVEFGNFHQTLILHFCNGCVSTIVDGGSANRRN